MSRRKEGAPGRVQGRGNRTAHPFVGKPNLTKAVRKNVATQGVSAGATFQVCPVCGLEVAVRTSDGRLRSHRVGSSMKQSWPCPGASANTDTSQLGTEGITDDNTAP